MDVRFIMNMMDENDEWSFVHRFPVEVLKQQSEASGTPLLHNPSSMKTYEDDFTRVISEMKEKGNIEAGVFGDIDLDEHREWVENICRRSEIDAVLPLWGMSQDEILTDFTKQGFHAVIIACNEKYLGEEWLGRNIDGAFYNHLKEMQEKKSDITTCGEAGEYHTLVLDAPFFSQRIEILQTEHRYHNGYWFLEIQKSKLIDK